MVALALFRRRLWPAGHSSGKQSPCTAPGVLGKWRQRWVFRQLGAGFAQVRGKLQPEPNLGGNPQRLFQLESHKLRHAAMVAAPIPNRRPTHAARLSNINVANMAPVDFGLKELPWGQMGAVAVIELPDKARHFAERVWGL
jgi:hypothetical protein